MPRNARGAARSRRSTGESAKRKRQSAALFHQAFHDNLTGLPNRALLTDHLEEVLARARSAATRTAVLFLDLDRLKWVNDSLGHAAGDDVLVTVARRLAASVRRGEMVARISGDEFVAVCEDVGADDAAAVAVADRLAAAVAGPIGVDGHVFALTASIGLVVAEPHSVSTPKSLLHDADVAMYRAKERGRDRVERYDGELDTGASRLETAAALRRAIDVGELRVHYQAVVDLRTGRAVGVEALVRWDHPERGLVPPAEFVPVAEESGLILPLGRFVLGEACRQVAEWNRGANAWPPLSVAVNLSAPQLTSPGLAGEVAAMLETAGLDPSLLCLEITESALMDDAGASRDALEQLKAVGVTLAVDDFGTGYSSLLYLRRFPVDLLKVDRSFVAGMLQSPEDGAIVTAVLGLGRALGLSTVAEGVETDEHVARLAALGCDLAQGFRWNRPLPPEEFIGWMDAAWSTPAEPRRVCSVLVVDDDPALRRALRLSLESEGGFVVVGEAPDGAEGIALARAHQPDLVLLDLVMPGMGGLEALPRILEVAPDTKVAVLTALDAPAARGCALPAADWLDKADLGRTIERLSELAGLPR